VQSAEANILKVSQWNTGSKAFKPLMKSAS